MFSEQRTAVLWPQPSINRENWPKISIVTPSLNQAQFLESTIQSILSQEYPNLEYIVIDGGSTDGSLDIIKKYSRDIHHWVSEPDGGMYSGIVKGLSLATGEVLGWLNSDDLYLPWALKAAGSIMADLPQVEWISSLQPALWDEEGLSMGVGNIAGFSREAFCEGRYLPNAGRYFIGWIQQESTFWRRTLWRKIDQERLASFAFAGDFYLWSQFLDHAILTGVPIPLGGFRIQPRQQTRIHHQEYMREAESCISGLGAADRNWRVQLRKTAISLRIHRLPKLDRIARLTAGYTGTKLKKTKRVDGLFWETENYKFL